MIKLCHFPAHDERGHQLLEIFRHPDQLHHSYMDKVASPFLPEIREYLDSLKPNPNSIYALVNALGAYEYWSCFPDGAAVKTAHGRMPIEEVPIGERVITHQNRWQKVTAKKRVEADWELTGLYVRGLPQMEPFIEATPLHELWVVPREEMIRKRREHFYYKSGSRSERREAFVRELEFDWVQIGELRPGDYISQPFPLEEDSPLVEQWGAPEIATLAGIYAAEGCTADRYDSDMLPDTDPTSFVIFVIGEEPEVVESIKRCAGKFGYIPYFKHTPETHSYRVQLSWADFARFCRDHIGHGALNKFLSDEILRMPRSWQKTFFDAYSHGDGCQRGEKKGLDTIRCVTASIQLALDTRLLLARLGLLSSVSGRHNKKSTWYNGNPTFELSVGGSQLHGDVQNVSGYLHPNGYILSPIKEVMTRQFKGWVNDLRVEEDQSYTINGVGVHNSNINGDGFEEEFLIHRGPVYGYETFLVYAKPFMHHANKDPARAFGAVELSCYNPSMHRVELVVRIDRDAAERVGAQRVVDKIDKDMLPDTSMGTKVPYDLCSITTDWDLYRKAVSTYKPDQHRHPGIAVLQFHKQVKPIRGLSITRDDYSDYLKFRMNEILQDGRKVCAFNPYPRFFDISFVFIGADKTSKMMAKLAEARGRAMVVVPSSYMAEHYGYRDREDEMPATHKEGFEKAASVTSDSIERTRQMLRTIREKKASQSKRAEITKEVVPSQFMGTAVPVLEGAEPELPKDVLDEMGHHPLEESLSTPTMMGITLKPHEFQRIVLIRSGKSDLADDMDEHGQVFSPTQDVDRGTSIDPQFISKLIASLLGPAIDDRSALGPPLTRRIIRITITKGMPQEGGPREPIKNDLMDKVSAAYNGYREQLIEKIAEMTQQLSRYPEIQAAIHGVEIEDLFAGTKTASELSTAGILGVIPAAYLISSLAEQKIQRDMYSGKAPSYTTQFIATHPKTLALGGLLGALHVTGSKMPKEILTGVVGIGKRIFGMH
jgi:hypothetical protein